MTDITPRRVDLMGDVEADGPDRRYWPFCQVCGVDVKDWRLHKRWHEKLDEAVGQSSGTTTG